MVGSNSVTAKVLVYSVSGGTIFYIFTSVYGETIIYRFYSFTSVDRETIFYSFSSVKGGAGHFLQLSSVNGGTGHFLQSVVLLTERPAILYSFSSVNGREGPFSTVLVLLTERPFSKDSAVLVLLTEEPFSTVCESTPVMMLLDNVLTRPRLFQRISLACTCIGLHHPLARRRFPSRHLKNI